MTQITNNMWSGNLNSGAYWGLVRNIGPYEETTEDQRRMNSQAGGPHAGHGNWMQSFNPHPYIQTTPPTPMYKYYDLQVVDNVDDIAHIPYDLKIPGITKSGSDRPSINGKSNKQLAKLLSLMPKGGDGNEGDHGVKPKINADGTIETTYNDVFPRQVRITKPYNGQDTEMEGDYMPRNEDHNRDADSSSVLESRFSTASSGNSSTIDRFQSRYDGIFEGHPGRAPSTDGLDSLLQHSHNAFQDYRDVKQQLSSGTTSSTSSRRPSTSDYSMHSGQSHTSLGFGNKGPGTWGL